MLTAPIAVPALAEGTGCLGGVEGLIGLGRLFLLENVTPAESKLFGDIDVASAVIKIDAPAWDCCGSAGTPGAQTLFSALDIPNGDT